MADRARLTIKILVLIIVLLVLVVAYALAVRPAISGYIVNKQVGAYQQGQADLLNNILVQMQQVGYAQIPVGNYTLFLQGQLSPAQ